jgi:hypothetical protein
MILAEKVIGELAKGIVPGAGDSDAVEGVLYPALGVSPALRKRFNKECLDLSLRWTLGTRGGSGSASCLPIKAI